MAPPPAPRDASLARTEIRAAEAARMLGLHDGATLPPLAEQWLLDGIDSRNVRALAGAATSGANPTPAILLELLASIVLEQRLTIASTTEARAIQAEALVSLISRPAEFTPRMFALSNTLTDELTARLRRFFGRFRSPR